MKKLLSSALFYFALFSLSFFFLQAQENPILFDFNIKDAQPGEVVCVDLEVSNFNGIVGFQFGMAWDTAGLEFLVVDSFNLSGLNIRSFGDTRVDDGLLFVSWTDPTLQGVDLADSTSIFQICFRVKESSNLGFSYVTFDSRFILMEVFNEDLILTSTSFRAGGVTITDPDIADPITLSGTTLLNAFCGIIQISIDLSVSSGLPPYTYEWIGPGGFTSTEEDISSSNGEGIYSVTVTDLNGLTRRANFFLQAVQNSPVGKPLIQGNRVENTACGEANGSIELELNVPQAPFSYEWSNGATTTSISDLEAGEYLVTVTLGDCTETDSIRVASEADFQLEQFIEPFESCIDTVTEIGLLGENSNQLQYLWNTGDTTVSIEVNTAGNFAVIVSDPIRNCIEEYEFEVEPVAEDFDFMLDLVVDGFEDCTDPDANISLRSGADIPEGFSFLWSTGQTSSDIDVSSTGVYVVEITQESTGCTQVDSIAIEDAGAPLDFGIISEVLQTGTCVNPSASIALQNPDNRVLAYNWNTGVNNSIITVFEPGTFEVNIIEAGTRCEETYTFTIDSSFFKNNLGLLSEITPFNSCDGDTASIQIFTPAESDYVFNWNTGQTIDRIVVTEPGLYEVTVTDQQTGCAEVLAFPLSSPQVGEVSLSQSCLPIGFCDTASMARISAVVDEATQGPHTFEWSNGFIDEADLSSSVLLPSGALYSLTVTNALGCTEVSESRVDDCPFDKNNLDIRVRTYFDCEDETPDASTTYLYAEVLNGASEPPYIFEWNNGEVDTSYFRSRVEYDPLLPSYAVTVTDMNGKVTEGLSINDPSVYGCGMAGNRVEVEAEHIIVSQGDQFVYPITVKSDRQVGRLLLTEDWDDCLLRLDSIIDYSRLDQAPLVFKEESLVSFGTYELGFGTSGGDLAYPDSFVVQEFYFTVIGESGISPFLFSINEPPVYEDQSPAFVNPSHGSITVVQDVENELVTAGDANNNGTINHIDLFNIGLFFESRGPDRRLRTTDFSEEYCPPWLLNAANGLNLRHVDCNGDGQINEEDVNIISTNWQSAFAPNLQDGSSKTDISLFVAGDSIILGENNVLRLSVENGGVPTDFYGVAFTLVYDPLLINASSLGIRIEESILREEGNDVPQFVFRHFEEESRLQVAVVKTNGQDINTEGPIAQLEVTLLDEATGIASFTIEDIIILKSNEEQLTGTSRISQLPIGFFTVNTIAQIDDHLINIYPNPVNDQLYLETGDLQVEVIELLDLNGKVLKRLVNNSIIEVAEFQSGIYLIKVYTADGVGVKQWVKY